jgi:hypothetical protein
MSLGYWEKPFTGKQVQTLRGHPTRFLARTISGESKVNVYLNGTKVATVGRPTQASS